MAWDRKVPIDKKTGSLMHYEEWNKEAYTYVDQKELQFKGTLKFDHFVRGRSAAYAIFRWKPTGATFPVSLNDMETFMSKLVDGVIDGEWMPVKRGANFFLAPVDSGK